MKKREIFILLILFVMTLYAENPRVFASSAGVIIGMNGNFGYKSGIGIQVDMKFRKGMGGGLLNGNISYERKIKAYAGYTYNLNAALRIYLKNFYFSSGYSVSGYESYFHEHSSWKKESRGFFYAVGFDNDKNNFELSYSPPENTSINHVSAIKFDSSLFLSKLFILKLAVVLQKYKQNKEDVVGVGVRAGILLDLGKNRNNF